MFDPPLLTCLLRPLHFGPIVTGLLSAPPEVPAFIRHPWHTARRPPQIAQNIRHLRPPTWVACDIKPPPSSLPPPSLTHSLTPMPPFFQFRVLRQSSAAGESPTPQYLDPLRASRLEVGSSSPDSSGVSLSQGYTRIAQDLRSSLPPTCRWLNPEDVDLVGEHPIAAGGFANIHEAKYGGHKVALKSYRCYVSFDVAQVVSVCYGRNLYRVHC